MSTPLYTQEDLDAVKAAVIKLSTGKRTVEVNISGGEKITYSQVDLPDLRILLNEINASVNPATIQRLQLIPTKGL